MLKKKHLIPGSMPHIICYDNNCGLYKWCAAREQQGETLHLNVGLPVDVFHWTCKHKKLLAAAGLGQSQWPMSSSKKSYILTKAKLHTYVEL